MRPCFGNSRTGSVTNIAFLRNGPDAILASGSFCAMDPKKTSASPGDRSNTDDSLGNTQGGRRVAPQKDRRIAKVTPGGWSDFTASPESSADQG